MNSQFSILNSQFNNRLFWDTDPASLDPEIHKSYIIPRVVDYGDWEDVKILFRVYDKDTIKDVLLRAPYLDRKTISFFSALFNLPKTDFRAYERRQIWKTWK